MTNNTTQGKTMNEFKDMKDKARFLVEKLTEMKAELEREIRQCNSGAIVIARSMQIGQINDQIAKYEAIANN